MKKSNLLDFFMVCIITLTIFQRILISFYSFFSYIDEIILVLFGILYIFRTMKRKKILKQDFILCVIILIMIVLGMIGNSVSGYDRKISLKMEAILFWFKSFATFIFAYSFFNTEDFNSNSIIQMVSKIVKIMVVIAFIMLVFAPITHIGIEMNPLLARYGLKPYSFIYPKAAIFSWYCLLFMMVLTLENALGRKRNFVYLILMSIVWFFTLRSRAFVFIIVYWVLYVWIFKIPKEKIPKIKVRHVAIIAIITLVIAIPAIEKYFIRSNASRAILLRTGIDIGISNFPVGAGFANYGTTASYREYSNLYYHYGFNKIYALKYVEGSSNEITDSYWPAIIGEMGFLGFILMIVLIATMFRRLLIKSKNSKWAYMCVLFLVITSLFSSIATPVFSEDIMISYMLIAILACYVKTFESSMLDKKKDEYVIEI